MPVGATAEEEGRVAGGEVLARQRGQLPLDRQFRRMVRETFDRAVEPCFLRNVAEKFVDRAGTDRMQHLAAVRFAQRQITHLVGLPHDEAKTDVVRNVGADAGRDGLADLGALVLGNTGAVEPATAESGHPLADAVRHWSRAFN